MFEIILFHFSAKRSLDKNCANVIDLTSPKC